MSFYGVLFSSSGTLAFYGPAIFLHSHPFLSLLIAALFLLLGVLSPRINQKLEPRAPKVLVVVWFLYLGFTLLFPITADSPRIDSFVVFLGMFTFTLFGLIFWLNDLVPDLSPSNLKGGLFYGCIGLFIVGVFTFAFLMAAGK
jgi:hypothetical protein